MRIRCADSAQPVRTKCAISAHRIILNNFYTCFCRHIARKSHLFLLHTFTSMPHFSRRDILITSRVMCIETVEKSTSLPSLFSRHTFVMRSTFCGKSRTHYLPTTKLHRTYNGAWTNINPAKNMVSQQHVENTKEWSAKESQTELLT